MTGPLLVSGASGFLGRTLLDICARVQRPVVVLGRARGTGARPRAPTVLVELADEAALARAVEQVGPAAIIHLAAYGVAPQDRDPVLMQRVNVDLPAALVRAAAGCGAAFVSAGSCAEYADPGRAIACTEESPLETRKLYGSSKAAGGLLGLATAAALGVRMRHLRLFNVYGPGEATHRLLPSLLADQAAGRRVRLSEGSQTRDFLHAADAAQGLLRAADRLIAGESQGVAPLNLCTGTGTQVRDFVAQAAAVLGIPSTLLGFGDLPMRPDEIPYLVGDTTKMAFDLAWRPAYGPAEGIKAALGVMMAAPDNAAVKRGGEA